jgi:hypothetical protein
VSHTSPARPSPRSRGDQKNYFAQLRAQGVKVIETGWTFVSAKVSLPYYCFGAVTVLNGGQKQGYFYMTKVIGMSPNTLAQLSEAWTKYALALHPGSYWEPRPGCGPLPADPAKQQDTFDAWVKQWTDKKYEIVRDDLDLIPARLSRPPPIRRRATTASFCKASCSTSRE